MAAKGDRSARAASAVDQKIGSHIRARRLEIGMSQEGLADHLGITFQQVQKYEKGVNRVAASTLVDIAKALQISVTSLLPEVDPGSGSSERNVLDEPSVAELIAAVRDLNSEGRRVLTSLAHGLAKDPKLGARRRG